MWVLMTKVSLGEYFVIKKNIFPKKCSHKQEKREKERRVALNKWTKII